MDGDFVGQERTTYHDRIHKLVTFFIMTAGSAKIAQFPVMFILYGGAPFLIAYFIFLAAVAMPIMLLESSLGQFAADGNRGIFSTVPLYTGVGYTMTLYVVLHMIGDSLMLSDCILYIVRTFYGYPLPECTPDWGPYNRSCHATHPETAICRMIRSRLAKVSEDSFHGRGFALNNGNEVVLVPASVYLSEATACSPGMHTPLHSRDLLFNNWVETAFTTIETPPLLSISATWLLVFLLGHRGFIKARFFLYAMTLLYLLTTSMLLLQGVTMPGAMGGLSLLLHADWRYILDTEMWSNALYVSLESVGITGSMYLAIVKFNSFRNVFQKDVKYVLVVDTAFTGIGIVITLMALGSLASNSNMDVAMLVQVDSRFIVSITPQAVGIISYTGFWSRVYCLWLISTIMPKFVLVPDIVLELLSASHPPLLENRTLVHFFICMSLVMLSVLFCCPGGQNIALAIFHQHDQRIRFVILLLESLVILQYYGLQRLHIDFKIMTGRVPNLFVNLGWTIFVPLTAVTLLITRFILDPWAAYNSYPSWTRALFTWIDLVELSFIPVFAVVFNCHTINFRQAVAPLPTWEPSNWEQAMQYRQMLVAEGLDKKERLASPPQRVQSKKSSVVVEQTTTDALGGQIVVTDGTRPTPGDSMRIHDTDGTNRSSRPVILAPDPSLAQTSAGVPQQPLAPDLASTPQAPGQAPPVPADGERVPSPGASPSVVPSPQVMTPDSAEPHAVSTSDMGRPPAIIPPLLKMAVVPLSSPHLKEATNEPVLRQLAGEVSPPGRNEAAARDEDVGIVLQASPGAGVPLSAGASSPASGVVSGAANSPSPFSGAQSPLLRGADVARDKKRKAKRQKKLRKQGRPTVEGTPQSDVGNIPPPAADRPA